MAVTWVAPTVMLCKLSAERSVKVPLCSPCVSVCACVCVWVGNTSHMAGDGRSTANVNKPQKWIVSGCSALLLIALNHNVALRRTTVSSCDSECFVFVSSIVFCFVLHYFVFWLFIIYLIACNSISQLGSCAEHAKLWAKWNLREREREEQLSESKYRFVLTTVSR